MKNLKPGTKLIALLSHRCVGIHINKNDIVEFIRYNTVYNSRISVKVKHVDYKVCDEEAVWDIKMFKRYTKRKQVINLP